MTCTLGASTNGTTATVGNGLSAATVATTVSAMNCAKAVLTAPISSDMLPVLSITNARSTPPTLKLVPPALPPAVEDTAVAPLVSAGVPGGVPSKSAPQSVV